MQLGTHSFKLSVPKNEYILIILKAEMIRNGHKQQQLPLRKYWRYYILSWYSFIVYRSNTNGMSKYDYHSCDTSLTVKSQKLALDFNRAVTWGYIYHHCRSIRTKSNSYVSSRIEYKLRHVCETI